MATAKRVHFESGDPLSSPSLNLVEPNLFLGNRAAAIDHNTLTENNITHILSIDMFLFPKEIINKFNIIVYQIEIADNPNEDLISHFNDTYDFIIDGLKHGSVLVHCFFGISRSATVVTAYLMKKYNYTVERALEELRNKRALINPNPGFLYQLQMYHGMRCDLDKDDNDYKLFKLKNGADYFKSTGQFKLAYTDVVKPESPSTHTPPSGYCCKSCGKFLCGSENLLPHNIPGHKNLICDELISVEPLSWMEGVMKVQEGNINCPKCSIKIGYFSWISDLTCACGFVLNPYFIMLDARIVWWSSNS